MSRSVLHVFATVVFGLASAGAYGGEAIHWATDLEDARAAAVAQDKLLLLHFWAPDCGPCKVLDQNVFPLPSVVEAINQHFIPLKVNAYQNRELRDHFKVDRWPTDIISTADGQTISRMITPQNPDRYVHELMGVTMKHRSQSGTLTTSIAGNRIQPTSSHAGSGERQNPMAWADGVEVPELSENTARATRPGIDSRSVPGMNPTFRSDAADFGISHRTNSLDHARFGEGQSDSFSGDSTPYGSVDNRFDTRDDVTASPSIADSEIENPYYQPRSLANEAGEKRQVESFEHPQQAVKPQQSFAASEVPARPGGVREQQSRQTRQNPELNEGIAKYHLDEPNQSEYPPVGLDGRCPVTLITKGTWKKGDARWGVVHRGNLYLFAGAQEQEVFLKNPDKFSPVLAGMDVVRLAEAGKVAQGSRQFGVLFDDDGGGPNSSRIYLFDSVDSRNRFEATPDLFLRPVLQAVQQGALETLLR